jgi:diguanylate cyclase (GGDEF)-like protein/PAS domain S-box-containing protein
MIREERPRQSGTGDVLVVPPRLGTAAADPYAALDAEGTFLLVNDAFVAETGQPAEVFIGRRLDEVWAVHAEPGQPDTRPELLDRVRREAIVRIDAHLEVSGRPEHALVLFVGSGAGATVPSSFGLSLAGPFTRRRSEATVQIPIDQLTVGVAVYGLDGRVLQLNDAMYRLFGRTPEDMPASDTLLIHPEDRAEGVERGLRAYRGEIDGWTRTKRIVRPDGELVWVEESVTLVRDGDGVPVHFIAQHIDVTEARRNQQALAESEAQVRFLTDGLPVALIEVDADGRFANSNSAARELLGDDLAGQSFAAVTHPDDRRRVRRAFAHPDGDGPDCQIEFRIRRRDGQWRWARAHARLHVDAHHRLTKAIATVTDITDEVAARESSERLSELLESVEDIVVIADHEGRITYLNAMGRSLLGDGDHRDDIGIGHRLADLFAPESAAEINTVALPTVEHFGSWTGEARIAPPGMEHRTVLLSLVSHLDATSGQASISALTRDITELKRAEDAMRRQATSDPLTALPNRAILFDRLNHALARTSRSGGGLALLFVDLDRFKGVNDQMGHDAGDELLVQVARRLADSVRDCDTVARIGGDEFVVLAEPVIRFEDALVVANRIVAALAEPFELSGGPAHIGASVGVAMSQRDSTSRALLKQADTALYQAKAAGRSCVVTYGGEPAH